AISQPLEVKVGDLTIRGPQTGTTPAVVSGSGVSGIGGGPADVVDVDPGASVTIANLAIKLAKSDAVAAIDVTGSLELDNSELSGNSSTGLVAESGSTVTIRNSTLYGNARGGVAAESGADVQLFNATIARNTSAGVFMDGGTAELTNAIVAGNGSDCQGSGSAAVTSSTHSLVQDGSCLAGLPPAGHLTGDPKPGPPSLSNGGTTATAALLDGSPAIDSGTNSPCPAVDQRYAPRNDGKCDIGAYERQTETTPPVITVPADLTAEATSPAGA